MALNFVRSLAAVSKSSVSGVISVCGRELQAKAFGSRDYSTDAQLSRKDVVHMLDNRDDPDVDAAVKAYMKAQFAGKAAPEKAEQKYELADKVERKYVAAQVVEYGIQNIAVPLAYTQDNTAPVKRFVSQLVKLGAQAGFEDPSVEVEKRVAEKAQTAETVKELLSQIKSCATPDYHAALTEALQQVEAETNSTVTLDGSSPAYKKFAEKVKAIATANKLPWQTLLSAKKTAGLDEDARTKVRKEYQAWVQSAQIADAMAELDVLKSEGTALLDKHLAKSADQIRKEQEAALASLQKKIDAAKGANWAQQYQEDLKALSWFDSQVAADPANGPRATA